jgi:hypothetical protein
MKLALGLARVESPNTMRAVPGARDGGNMRSPKSIPLILLATLGVGACAAEVSESEQAAAGAEPSLDVTANAQALSGGVQGVASVGASGTLGSRFNTSGQSVSSFKLVPGSYSVTFSGLGAGTDGFAGHAQVVSSGTLNRKRCKVESWNAGGTSVTVNVRCHLPPTPPSTSSTLASSNFHVHYMRNTVNNGHGAYLLADSHNVPLNQFVAPSSSWNSTNGANLVARVGTGLYDVFLQGLETHAGTVQVTAFGSGAEYCKVESWFPISVFQQVRVNCFNGAGSPVNAKFLLNYTGNQQVSVFDQGAYVWANDANASAYTPAAAYSFSGLGSACGTRTIQAIRTSGVGLYAMRFGGADFSSIADKTTAFVTAYGPGPNWCNVASDFEPIFNVPSTFRQYQVHCFGPSKSTAPSQYLIQLVVGGNRGPCG